MAALKYWLWLTTRRGMDPASALTVLDHFATPERAYYADNGEYEQLPVRPAIREALCSKELKSAEQIMADCDRLNVRIMTFHDGDYPQRLRQLADPPMVLYVKGRVFHFDEEAAIGVVGAREPTAYGMKYASRFGMELALGGALVVSGMAQGLDACAVKGALKAGGPVVSVLAGGVDVPFPSQHRYLYEDVASVGALVSEYPPGTRHMGHHFPRRNRILSGLCLGVLAVECRPYGGTMSTINHALEQDRDVFAVPGALDAPMSEGTNRLIQQGAKLVICGRDILEEYWRLYPGKLAPSMPLTPETAQVRAEDAIKAESLTPTEEKPEEAGADPSAPSEKGPGEPQKHREQKKPILSQVEQKEQCTDDELALLHGLKGHKLTAEELVEETQLPARRVLSGLTMLQVRGLVEEGKGRRFVSCVELEP